MESRVYFLRQVGGTGPVKIGVSKWPEERLATYQRWSPVPIEIVASMSGDHKLERRLHSKFEHLHLYHEWFRWAPEMAALVSSVLDGTFTPDGLPRGINLYDPRRRAALATEAA